MPPKSPKRTTVAEEALARRIRAEREHRGWSPAGLAARMTKAGCPLTQSAIWKIENGEPRRRITLDEAVTFARVFEIELLELTLPPNVLAAEEAARTVVSMRYNLQYVEDIGRDQMVAWRKLADGLASAGEDYDLVLAATAAAIRQDLGSDEPQSWWGASSTDEVERRRDAAQNASLTPVEEARQTIGVWIDEFEARWKAVFDVYEHANSDQRNAAERAISGGID